MHEITYLWINYFWSSLKGNGPEALVQTVLYGLIALAVVPPFRHWFERHVKSIHEKLDAHHIEILEQAERHHKEHLEALKSPARKPPVKKVVSGDKDQSSK